MREGGSLLSFIWPAQNPELMQQLAAKKATVLAIDSLPRQLSRAQKMDALTSMAGISGYRAVIEAANAFGRFFNGQITAAGKIPPAKVFIAGAGVAGLAAIGTAANLGAIVRANDTRAEVADQVVSLGGEFVKVDYEEEGSGGGGYAKVMSEGFLQAQREMYAKQAKEADIIITTALIPGKPAPKLITAEMVKSMKPGSVIVDMAGEQGGNCELTVPGEAVVRHGVTIIGYTDLVSRLAKQSSTLYSTNLFRVTEELCKTKDGVVINVNIEDDAIRGLTVIKEGSITWPPPPLKLAGRRPQAGCGRRPPRPPPRRGMAMAAPANRCRPSRWPRCLAWARWPSCSSACMHRPASCRTSRCSCWPASSATWWSGTSRLAAHAADERDQCHLVDHRHRRAGAGGAAAGRGRGREDRPNALILGLAVFALALTAVNMFGGFRGHTPHAGHVPQIRTRTRK
jgi:NAD(P) transhydrogenase subunit alpha